MDRTITFEDMEREYYEKYSEFLSGQVDKYEEFLKNSVDFLFEKVRGKPYSNSININLWLDEKYKGKEIDKAFYLNIDLAGENKIYFTVYEVKITKSDEHVGNLVLSDFPCWTVHDDEKMIEKWTAEREALEKFAPKDGYEIMQKVMSGELSSEDPRWKEIEQNNCNAILSSIPDIITEKGKKQAKLLFRRYITNSKLDQQEAVALYVLYPQYLLSKKMGLHFIRTIHQFEDLKQKYNFDAETIEKHHKTLLSLGYIKGNPDFV